MVLSLGLLCFSYAYFRYHSHFLLLNFFCDCHSRGKNNVKESSHSHPSWVVMIIVNIRSSARDLGDWALCAVFQPFLTVRYSEWMLFLEFTGATFLFWRFQMLITRIALASPLHLSPNSLFNPWFFSNFLFFIVPSSLGIAIYLLT